MADQYATAAARVAVSQLAEAAGFDAVHQSSVDTLADLLLRYINEVGSASHGYAELAGRTESNPLDVVGGGEGAGCEHAAVRCAAPRVCTHIRARLRKCMLEGRRLPCPPGEGGLFYRRAQSW